MECFKIENLNFVYPGRTEKALENINLTVNQGEFVLLCGKSGCGKTTLLRLLKSSLAPFGQISGNIFYKGKPVDEYEARQQAADVGFVMQSCDNQLVTDKVWHELSFGLESLGVKNAEIRTRVSETASFFGLQNLFYRNVSELSGGQKQLLNLASVMVMQPSVLILDEPASQLDPISAGEFLQTLVKINQELGTTIILTEHRLEDAFPVADRVVVMDEGKIISDANPEETGIILRNKNHQMYKALPTPVRVHGKVENSLPCPLTVHEGRMWLEEYAKENALNLQIIPKDKVQDNSYKVIEIKDVWYRYEKNSPDVVKALNLTVNKGELFCLVGGNGTGKTTALSLISGINKPYRGEIRIKGQKISEIRNLYNGLLNVLPQNPQSVFVKKSVYLDLLEMLNQKNFSKEEKEEKIKNVACLCRIESLLQSHPYDLSGGEQQRAALAKVLLTEPEILLLDEPTKGMDAHFKEKFANILIELKKKGTTIVMVSHDVEFCAEYATRCGLVFDGGVTSVDTPREFFKGKSFYTTAANRMARACLPDAVLAEDIILACGGKVSRKNDDAEIEKDGPANIKQKPGPLKSKPIVQDKKISERTIFTILLLLILVPVTIYAGGRIFGNRKYYLTSFLVIFETIIAFCISFESRKPKARELVVISVLCAIAVAGRTAFFGLSFFKPTVAIVIIAGVCMGAETGFLVGSITGFVSNFFFGQGPWTPWQMLALGIIGFMSGILFKKASLKKNKAILCIFGFLTTLIVYGGIMNCASVIMWQNEITREMIAAAIAAGLSVDLIHSFATLFFLWLISGPMIEKIERINEKYGLFTGKTY